MSVKQIKIHPLDNVIVALENINQGEQLQFNDQQVTLLQSVERGHKIAIQSIAEGENVIKYGYPIGHATTAIKAGEHVHSQNLRTNLSEVLEYTYQPQTVNIEKENAQLTFNGYRRKNGTVGIRNEMWIVPTVGCVNGTADAILKKFLSENTVENIDTFEVFKHNYGCSQLGDDHENTKNILGDIILHPNAAGVLVLGLGCENNKIEDLKIALGDFNPDRIKFLSTQSVKDEVEEGADLLKQIYADTKNDIRTPVSISELKVGLKCGGSDGLSGITANPLVGFFSDFLISQGGTTILTEVPEMFGAETILMKRCIDQSVFDKTVHLINDFKDYFIALNQPIYENPSPGNKAGGITTLEEKSLGCIQKGGQATVIDVLKYGERITQKGLNLLSGPGNDLVSATAMGAAGCHLILFTTGRGTPFGSFVPTLKISTNTPLAENKPHWIDFNAGTLVEEKTFPEVLDLLITKIIQTANGEKINHEKSGFREIAIFKSGVTL
ncbi:MAG: altronate dehydratase [Bacteroidetes bacterium]|nr:altronate dehydratase [Bacteroidota bacterium]